ncbi:hypothetical protein GT360_17800 [Vibrio astriarenae]|uniref:Uncharacterized protein n=1 Tax=Vibrio astriarenae TaxID=1481923 RepID=A0A7Z2T6Q2_9VIBR|nr:hypothetical protein [Vibrio astriarenae]QIA65394.1 hypothetical protein GT360_17800 [Vibrio astriarenae]
MKNDLRLLTVWHSITDTLPHRRKEPEAFIDELAKTLTYFGEHPEKEHLLTLSDSDIYAWIKVLVTGCSNLDDVLHLYGSREDYDSFSTKRCDLIESIFTVINKDNMKGLPLQVLDPLINTVLKHVNDITIGQLGCTYLALVRSIEEVSLNEKVTTHVKNLIARESSQYSEQLTFWLIILIDHACVFPYQLEQELNDCLDKFIEQHG